MLAENVEAEIVETTEGRQVRGNEGSVGHVEVFSDGCVETSIFPKTGTRATSAPTDLHHNCEEPRN